MQTASSEGPSETPGMLSAILSNFSMILSQIWAASRLLRLVLSSPPVLSFLLSCHPLRMPLSLAALGHGVVRQPSWDCLGGREHSLEKTPEVAAQGLPYAPHDALR